MEESKSYHRFSSRQQKAPTPKCVCFYNGTADREDTTVLRLSDAFEVDVPADIDVRVTMININYGHNKALLAACVPLWEYSFFVDRIHFYQDSMDNLEAAVDAALKDLPDESLLKPFLTANRAEVKRMCITEYDEARTFAEQREEGRAEGRAEGALEMLITLFRKGALSLAQAAEAAELTIPEFKKKAGLNT